jgi:hypothetical protein
MQKEAGWVAMGIVVCRRLLVLVLVLVPDGLPCCE